MKGELCSPSLQGYTWPDLTALTHSHGDELWTGPDCHLPEFPITPITHPTWPSTSFIPTTLFSWPYTWQWSFWAATTSCNWLSTCCSHAGAGCFTCVDLLNDLLGKMVTFPIDLSESWGNCPKATQLIRGQKRNSNPNRSLDSKRGTPSILSGQPSSLPLHPSFCIFIPAVISSPCLGCFFHGAALWTSGSSCHL